METEIDVLGCFRPVAFFSEVGFYDFEVCFGGMSGQVEEIVELGLVSGGTDCASYVVAVLEELFYGVAGDEAVCAGHEDEFFGFHYYNI